MWIHAVAILLRSGNLSHNGGRPLGENVVNRRRFIELREMAAGAAVAGSREWPDGLIWFKIRGRGSLAGVRSRGWNRQAITETGKGSSWRLVAGGTGESEDLDDHYQTKVSGECSWLYAGGDQEVPGVRG